MFKVNDLIIYGNNGVCKVTDIGPLEGSDNDMTYYTLEPVFQTGSRYFSPVDNKNVIMRKIITKKKALELIESIKDIEELWIADERKREEDYKAAVNSCDCVELVKIIKTIYLRGEARLAEGKKITSNDEKYFKIAEKNLYSEIACALKMDFEEAKQFVIDKVEAM